MLHSSSFRRQPERETRLIYRNANQDNRPFLRRIVDQTGGTSPTSDFLNPEKARARDLLSDRTQLSAFERPDIFSAQTDPTLAGQGGNTERLLSMTPTRRLEEFTAFVNEQIPEAVRQRYADLFTPPLDAVDIEEEKNTPGGGRIRTLLLALKIMAGDSVPETRNPRAFNLAKDTIAELNNTANSPGTMYRLYEAWLDSRPNISETDATTPEVLLRNDSGISDKLRGILGNLLDPAKQRSLLKEMYELYRNHQTDLGLENAQARLDHLSLTEKVRKREIERQGRTFIQNFQNASPGLKIGALAVGLFLGSRLLSRDKDGNLNHPLLFTGGLAALGWFGYDRFINGNENALNDMTNGLQKFVRFNGNMLKNIAREMGLPIPRSEADRLQLMTEFLAKNRLGGGPAEAGMEALAQVRLGTIADAFTPFLEGGQLGGTLLLTEDTPAGRLLRDELIPTIRDRGSSKREETLRYLESNNADIGAALAHVFYMIGASETRNLDAAERIDKAILETYGAPENLPLDLKTLYMQIAFEGKEIATSRYADKSFVDIIASLNNTKNAESERSADNAVEIPDPKTADRIDEFNAIENLRSADVRALDVSQALRDGGDIDADCQSFLRNCEKSGVVNADAAFALNRRFIVIRRESASLTEALQTIEKLKYAVFVQSTQQNRALNKDDIALLAGPDERSVTSMLNSVTGFLGRFISIPRGFQSVSSMADIRSILNEPWFGSGPVSSKGEGFNRLTQRLDLYERKFKDLRDLELMSKQMVAELSSTVTTALGGKAKAEAMALALLKKANYSERIDHNEAHLSQRMANALARSMRLRDTGEGFGSFDELGITPIEQKNLATEFDRYFLEIVGDSSKLVLSMWQKAEDIETLERFDLDALEAYDYSTEDERFAALQYARDLGIVHGIRVLSDQPEEPLRKELLSRAEKIYEKILNQKKADLLNNPEIKSVSSTNTPAREEQQLKNLYAALLIENQPSYSKESMDELRRIIIFLGGEVLEDKTTFDQLLNRELFPENLEQSRSIWPEFLKEWNPFKTDVIEYWRNVFRNMMPPPPNPDPSVNPATQGVAPGATLNPGTSQGATLNQGTNTGTQAPGTQTNPGGLTPGATLPNQPSNVPPPPSINSLSTPEQLEDFARQLQEAIDQRGIPMKVRVDQSNQGYIEYCDSATDFGTPTLIARSIADSINVLNGGVGVDETIVDKLNGAYLKWQNDLSEVDRQNAIDTNDLMMQDPLLFSPPDITDPI